MAKNTYKSPTTNNGTAARKETAERKPTRRRQASRWSRVVAFFNDPRTHLTGGMLLLFLAFFLSIAFVSYLFTGRADQSSVNAVLDTPLPESGAETENWLGVTGAFLSHWFIYKWFGVSAFLLIPILFLAGYKIVFKRELFPIGRLTQFSVFAGVWISALLGYLVVGTEQREWRGLRTGRLLQQPARLGHGAAAWFHAGGVCGLFLQRNHHQGLQRENPRDHPRNRRGGQGRRGDTRRAAGAGYRRMDGACRRRPGLGAVCRGR
ncbi:MAG: DNA translocase FtsK 4TM domain-containing protein [Cytophagales bacterium]|nr:DNA translocase FtsK 4TM domain-containing protein [Cytophagales bacterium]